jgi:hypothetical protein
MTAYPNVKHVFVPTETKKEQRFYTFSQNNSGGRFVVDDDVAHYVIIAASSPEEADRIAESHGIYFDSDSDCECCGSRWSSASSYDSAETPQIYGKSPEEMLSEGGRSSERQRVIVYFHDGSKSIYERVSK